ncbi:MAG: four helix bundle protein [Calditrichia bacterium]|nr:four helix bundle protein [Calditrichia bacterium]
MMEVRRNKNRGYRKLRVWNEAIDYYKKTCDVFTNLPFELKRIASQQIASSDSVHRNISEGYCRRSIREYLNFLNIAISSLGESVSGIYACRQAKQISEDQYNSLDSQAYKLENGLLRLIESLEQKKEKGEWIDHIMVKENNEIYNHKNL